VTEQGTGARRRRAAGMTGSRQAGPRRAGLALLAAIAASVLAGCGASASSQPPNSTSSSLPTTSQAQSTAAETSSTSAAAPSTNSPPSFVVNATTQEGDKVKVEGRFGPALPASESDVDQTALSECPPPAPDGRAIVVRLDLVTTLESNLSGELGLETSYIAGRLVNFVLGFSEGARCQNGQPGEVSIKLGTLQPGQSADFTMWVVLPDAITSANPHPSEQTLGEQDWLMAIPQPTVNGSGAGPSAHSSTTGPRLVTCPRPYEANDEYIAVVGSTPTMIHESECPAP
jgi:hypothetical protein